MTFFHTKDDISLPDSKWVYFQKAYHDNNQLSGLITCGLKNSTHEICLAATFQIQDTRVVSLPKCPSAGIQIFQAITIAEITYFLKELIKLFLGKQIQIKQSTFFYQNDYPFDLSMVLETNGFKKTQEINHHITFASNSVASNFHQMILRKVDKCKKAGFVFDIYDDSDYQRIYQFIDKCRNQQQLSVNLSQNHFVKLLTNMSDYYKIYTVCSPKGDLAACTVILNVNSKIVYNFLPAFDRQFKAYSPLAYLNYEMFVAIAKEGFQYLDLGISSINGTPQEGLIKFKERLGGDYSPRETFIYSCQDHQKRPFTWS